MNEDYLWDKTGEPDPEIQQLEQILGTLRYQPRPLEIPAPAPAPAQTARGSFFFRGLAIAATIAMMLLGLGLWLGLQRRSTTEVSGTQNHTTTNDNSPAPALSTNEKHDDLRNDSVGIDRSINKPSDYRGNPRVVARNITGIRRASPAGSQLAADKRQEAIEAKEQLMLALRVASSKLNFAQKKTQSTNSENLIHNQHKIG